MSDEISLARDAARGARAKALLENELLVEAFEALEKEYTAAWRSTGARDSEAREKLYLAVNIVGKVREHLNYVINNGKLAQAELDKIRVDAERKKRFGII